MRTACIVARGPTQNHQHSWGAAFAEGLRRHGWDVDVSPVAQLSDLMVLWGVRNRAAIAAQKRNGGEVCILERGYVGDRMRWTSVGFGGGLNGRAEFRGVRDDGARFERHFGRLLRPWREKRGPAVIIGQVPGDMSLARVGGHLEAWYGRTAAALKAEGWRVVFRPHPLAYRRGPRIVVPGAPELAGTLEEALAQAGTVVTFNSNTAVEAVLAGVPTAAADEGSMAWPVTARTPGWIAMPDRKRWAARLAWCQWSLDEMRSGECWDAVGHAVA